MPFLHIRRRVALSSSPVLVALLVGGCELPTSTDPYPSIERAQATLRLLPGPFIAGQTALPVRVEAWIPDSPAGTHEHCVRLIASPGVVSFPFAGEPAPDAGPADAGTDASVVYYIVRAASPKDGGLAEGHALARYLRVQPDETATIFGELLATEDCSSDVLASTAAVFSLDQEGAATDGAAPEGDRDEDAGADPTDPPVPPAPPDDAGPLTPDAGPMPADEDAGSGA